MKFKIPDKRKTGMRHSSWVLGAILDSIASSARDWLSTCNIVSSSAELGRGGSHPGADNEAGWGLDRLVALSVRGNSEGRKGRGRSFGSRG